MDELPLDTFETVQCVVIRCLKNLDFMCTCNFDSITPNNSDKCLQFTRIQRERSHDKTTN